MKAVKPKKHKKIPKVTNEDLMKEILATPRLMMKELFVTYDHLLEKINRRNDDFRHAQKQIEFAAEKDLIARHVAFEKSLKQRQDAWEMMMREHIIRIADDSVRAVHALQRLMNMIDEAVFTPEVKKAIIEKIRCQPPTTLGNGNCT